MRLWQVWIEIFVQGLDHLSPLLENVFHHVWSDSFLKSFVYGNAEYHFKQQLLIHVARHVNCNKKQLLKKLEGKVRGLVVHRTQQTGRRIIAGRPRARSARIYFNRKKTLDHRPLARVGLVCRRARRAASSFDRRFFLFLKKKKSNGFHWVNLTGKSLYNFSTSIFGKVLSVTQHSSPPRNKVYVRCVDLSL